LTGCACLAGANDVRSPVAVSDNDPTRRPKIGTLDNADQDSLAVKTFSCDPAGAVPFDGDSFSGGKVRSVSAMAQPVNVIRGSATLRAGTVIMEHLTHHQNLALCRRLLAEAELATSSDEIRHSMLMRLPAEEEANVLVMPVAVIVVRPNCADISSG
jgi:hypothetical protein